MSTVTIHLTPFIVTPLYMAVVTLGPGVVIPVIALTSGMSAWTIGVILGVVLHEDFSATWWTHPYLVELLHDLHVLQLRAEIMAERIRQIAVENPTSIQAADDFNEINDVIHTLFSVMVYVEYAISLN